MKSLLLLTLIFTTANAWAALKNKAMNDEVDETKPVVTKGTGRVGDADPATEGVDPKLPNVLIVGDSISLGYTPLVVKPFKGQANVFHCGGLWNENASSSSFTLSRIDTWLAFRDIKCKTAPPHPGANKIEIHNPTVDFSTYRLKWDVIVCNWGMWEIINDGKPANSVPVEKYATNLTSLFDKMKATGAILIWATTTPVPEKNKRGRREADVVAYNAAAQKVVDAAGAVTVDLHGLVAAKLTSDWRRNGNAEEVHFNDAGNQFLAGHINAAIQAALARRK